MYLWDSHFFPLLNSERTEKWVFVYIWEKNLKKCPYHKFHIISPLHRNCIYTWNTRRSKNKKILVNSFFFVAFHSSSFIYHYFVRWVSERERKNFMTFKQIILFLYFLTFWTPNFILRWVNKRGNNHIYLYSKQ